MEQQIPGKIFEAGTAAVIVFLFVLSIFYITKLVQAIKSNGKTEPMVVPAASDQGEQRELLLELKATLQGLCESQRRMEQVVQKISDTHIRLTTLLEYQQQMQNEFIKTQRSQNEILSRLGQDMKEKRERG